jgi:hypothetical protein
MESVLPGVIVSWKRYNATGLIVKISSYAFGGIRISLENKGGELWAVATSYVRGLELGASEVAIKTYSENEGIDKALMDAGVISERIRMEGSWPIHRLLKIPDDYKPYA